VAVSALCEIWFQVCRIRGSSSRGAIVRVEGRFKVGRNWAIKIAPGD
jgi:hypothetical protein